MAKYMLTCIGDINWDTIIKVRHLPEPDGETRIAELIEAVGGDAANVATTFARLGGSVLMIGEIGNDVHGQVACQSLSASGVDVSRVMVAPDMPTGRVYAIVEEGRQRRLLHWRGANMLLRLTEDDLSRLQESQVIYVADPLATTLQTIVRWYEEGRLSSCLAFDPGMATVVEGFDFVAPLLKYVTVLFMNEPEALTLTKCKKLEDAIRVLQKICEVVVIKLGDKGAIAMQGQTLVKKPAYPVEAVDSTGCGDAFNAAFLFRWLQTSNLEEALQWGNAAGAAVVRKLGAKMPTKAEVLQIIEDGYERTA